MECLLLFNYIQYMALRCCHTTYTEEKERRHSESQKVTGRRNIKHVGIIWKAGKVEEVKVSGKENQRGTKPFTYCPHYHKQYPRWSILLAIVLSMQYIISYSHEVVSWSTPDLDQIELTSNKVQLSTYIGISVWCVKLAIPFSHFLLLPSGTAQKLFNHLEILLPTLHITHWFSFLLHLHHRADTHIVQLVWMLWWYTSNDCSKETYILHIESRCQWWSYNLTFWKDFLEEYCTGM